MRSSVSRAVLLALCLLVFSSSSTATNPPNKGRFPKGFWRTLAEDPALLRYGDPGWVKRMDQRRLARLQMALGKRLRPTLQTDTFVLPVLLGEYSDSTGTFTVEDFQNLLFDNNPTGTLTDYYDEISYGQFALTGNVYGWFRVDQPRSYYAGNNNGGSLNFPQNAAGFVLDVVAKADPTVDFRNFDNDGPDGIPNSGDDDGYVDGVIAVYAGPGADWSPSNDNLWPRMSTLGDNEYTTDDPAAGGGMIKVSTFAVCPERAGGGVGWNQIRPIGVFAHEFGHILGLPDLYDRTDASEPPDYQASEGLGEWGLMATGSWGGDGNHTETPAHMTAWCKMQLGWITPTVVDQNTTGLAVREVESNAEAYIVWEDGYQWSRYFLLENRQKTGFDRYLNGDGLLVYHVDEYRRWGRSRWSSGPVNDDETHKLVDLEEADGRADLDNSQNRGDAGDPFPGTGINRAFSDGSVPNSRDYDGLPTGVGVTNISDSGPMMTADLVVRPALGYTLTYDEDGITGWGWGSQSAVDSWGGVRFTSAHAGTLAAVDVGLPYGSANYEIKVYRTLFGPTPTDLVTTVSGHIESAGWYTIDLPPGAASLQANKDFFVSIKIESKAYAISYDRWGEKSGRSYTSSDGITYSNSISTNPSGGDINLRARVRSDVSTSVADRAWRSPRRFSLGQNYPNPFNPSTEIRYELPRAADVRFEVFNLLGQRVAALAYGRQEAGSHRVRFDARDLPAGMYVYRLQAGEYDASRKMLLIK